MFKIIGVSMLILLVSLFMFSCSNVNDPTELADGEVDFLLISDNDPIELASNSSDATLDQAFLVDAHGPFMFWVLDLTDDQKSQMREIARSHREEFRGMRHEWHENEKSWEEIKEKREAMRQAIFEEIFQILTLEQQAIVLEMQDQLANGQYPTAVIEKRVAYLTAELDLNENQQAQIAAWLGDYGALILAGRESSDSKQEFHEARQAFFLELDEKILSILDEDQVDKYLELKEKRNGRHRHMRGKFGGS
jgi:Spy/CpxP family protein refolding chaperone